MSCFPLDTETVFTDVLLPDKFSADEIGLILIDDHRPSIGSAKKVFRQLDPEKFEADFIQTDACNYQHPRKLHLVISGTIQNSLANDRQTANTWNLAPQLCENGIFVPQRLTTEVCLANLGEKFGDRESIDLCKILGLEAEEIRQNSRSDIKPV